MSRVIWVGPIPPPLHGASMITARFLAQVVGRVGAEHVRVVSVAGGGRGWRHHRARALAHVRASVMVALGRPGTVVYLSLSGGLGLWYQWPVVALARLRRLPVVVHHHSWAYVSASSAVMAAVARLLGPRDRHLFLSDLMREGYLARYATGAAAEVVSNAHFIEAGPVGGAHDAGAAPRLVHVSNLSVAKGSLAAIHTHEELNRRGVATVLTLIGPCDDPSILAAVEAAGDAVRWLGPRSSAEIYDELADADVFLFPSSYANEAEPLVVLEALSRGVPVIATRRGTLPDLLPQDWLVGEPEPAALADRVEILLAALDPALGRRRARAVFDGLRRHDDPVDLVLGPSPAAPQCDVGRAPRGPEAPATRLRDAQRSDRRPPASSLAAPQSTRGQHESTH
jgi:glycosyltransferase involved in cell wall biosynthesis